MGMVGLKSRKSEEERKRPEAGSPRGYRRRQRLALGFSSPEQEVSPLRRQLVHTIYSTSLSRHVSAGYLNRAWVVADSVGSIPGRLNALQVEFTTGSHWEM